MQLLWWLLLNLELKQPTSTDVGCPGWCQEGQVLNIAVLAPCASMPCLPCNSQGVISLHLKVRILKTHIVLLNVKNIYVFLISREIQKGLTIAVCVLMHTHTCLCWPGREQQGK